MQETLTVSGLKRCSSCSVSFFYMEDDDALGAPHRFTSSMHATPKVHVSFAMHRRWKKDTSPFLHLLHLVQSNTWSHPPLHAPAYAPRNPSSIFFAPSVHRDMHLLCKAKWSLCTFGAPGPCTTCNMGCIFRIKDSMRCKQM